MSEGRRWTPDFALRYTTDKAAGGTAIFDSYKEFIQKDGSKDTLFYEYAAREPDGRAIRH